MVDLLRRAKVPVHMVSIQGKQAKGSHGIVIETEIGIAEVSEQIGDYLVLPGGMPGTKTSGSLRGAEREAFGSRKEGRASGSYLRSTQCFWKLRAVRRKESSLLSRI